MSKKHRFDSGIDLKKSEIANAVLQNLFIFPTDPRPGQVLYKSDLNLGAYWNGTVWLFFGLSENVLAALNAANSPDETNPFLTLDDLPVLVEDFIDLFDVPNAYTGAGLKTVRVKATEDGLEFFLIVGIPPGGTAGQILGKVSGTDYAVTWIDPPTPGADGVQSVTGDGVDNTDPDNPVLSFPTPGEIEAEPAFAKGNLVAGANISFTGSGAGRLVGAGDLVIESTGGGGGGTTGRENITGFPAIPFDKNYKYSHEMAGAIEISVDLSKPRIFPNNAIVYIKANGTNKPTFKAADNFSVVLDTWNNTAGEWNRLYFEWSPEGVPVVQITAVSGEVNPGVGVTVIELTFAADGSQSHVVTGSVEITVDVTGAAFPFRNIVYIMADGVNKPFWDSPIECNFDNYVNTAGVWNRLYFEYTPENIVTLQIQNT